MAPAIRICRLIRATVSSTSARGVDSTTTQRGSPPWERTIALSPIRSPPAVSTVEATRPVAAAAAAAG